MSGNYLATLGIALAQGEAFIDGDATAATDEVIVNQMFAKQLGLTNPVGSRVMIDSTAHYVRGVVEDFHLFGLWRPIEPAMFRLTTPNYYRYLTVRTNALAASDFAEALEVYWRQLYPDQPYEGFLQSANFFEAQQTTRNIRRTYFFQTLVVLFLSVTGLFALTSLDIARRLKEVSIRKVLGASIPSVIMTLNRSLLVMLGVAVVLGGIGGYLAGQAFIGSIYTYHVGVQGTTLAGAVLLLLITVGLTIGFKVYRAATANPATILRNE